MARTELGRDPAARSSPATPTPSRSTATPRARVDGDTLWGLGSRDMKGGLAVMLELARTVAEPAVDVTYVFYECEEVGAGVQRAASSCSAERPELLAGDAAILGEPTGARVEAGCQGTMRAAVRLAGARAHTARPWMGRNAIHRLGVVLDRLAAYDGAPAGARRVRVPRGPAGGARRAGAWPATSCPTEAEVTRQPPLRPRPVARRGCRPRARGAR